VQVALVVLAAEGLERPLAIGRLVTGVPVKPMKVALGRPAIRKLPRSPPVVRCASSMKTWMFFRRFRLAGMFAELVDHRHDDAPIVFRSRPVQCRDAAGVRHVAQATDARFLSI